MKRPLKEHPLRPMPATPALPQAESAAVEAALAAHGKLPGALLPVLHAVQDALGYVPPAAVPQIAAGLNQTRAEVHGVISFYHWFRSTPPGKQVLHLCRAEACQAQGGRELERHVKRRLGVDYHQTTTDGRYSLEPVYCLGNCAIGPSLMLGGELHGRVDAQRFDELAGP
jgi:formate dehydrogenase subunit gamma